MNPVSRSVLRSLTIGLTLAVGLLDLACSAAVESRPNVFVLLLDTVRVDALGCYGNPDQTTPHLDQLAAEGVLFTQAISTSGWTLPSVASLLTGTWPVIHGGVGKDVELRPIRDEVPTAAEVLRLKGVRTAAFANAAFVSPMLHLDRGFDVFDHRYTYNWDARRADETVDAALVWVRENRHRQSFVLVHLFDPHLDYDPPPGYAERFTGGRSEPAPPLNLSGCLALEREDGRSPIDEDIAYLRGVYHGEISFLDEQIGRFVEGLRAAGLYDDAIVVVVADHGEEFWDHGGFEHGHSLYDELVRVPLILKLPGGAQVARPVVDDQVRIIDVMPTLFEVLEIEAPESFVGRSLFPLIRGLADEERAAMCESTLYGEDRVGWRTERYKYIVDLDPDAEHPEELYDWRDDPNELEDLTAERPDLVLALRAELLAFYGGLRFQAESMSDPEIVDLNPERIKMLRELGYIR